jgi:hypothetical protein
MAALEKVLKNLVKNEGKTKIIPKKRKIPKEELQEEFKTNRSKKSMKEFDQDWQKGLSEEELQDILGGPIRDEEGILRSRKSGGPIGVGKALRGYGKAMMSKKKKK